MTKQQGVRPRTRHRWLPVAVLVTLAGLATGLAACGKNDAPGVATAGVDPLTSQTTESSNPDAFLFAQCMRDNGIENWPDPQAPEGGESGSAAGGPARVIAPEGVSPDEIQSAMQHCQQYLPDGGEAPSGPPDNSGMLAFAQCMRENGVPDFPDPPAGGGNMGVTTGVDPDSPEFHAAFEACRDILAGGGGQVSG
jgi:hypothetical protein